MVLKLLCLETWRKKFGKKEIANEKKINRNRT